MDKMQDTGTFQECSENVSECLIPVFGRTGTISGKNTGPYPPRGSLFDTRRELSIITGRNSCRTGAIGDQKNCTEMNYPIDMVSPASHTIPESLSRNRTS
jgi:hypothetical protein